MASNSRVRNYLRLKNEMCFSYPETGILKEHNHPERNNRIQFCLIFLSSLSVFDIDIMNLEKHWAFHESCTQNFSPISIQILDPKLLVSTRVLSANSLTNFASFLLTGTELKYHLPITYEQYMQPFKLLISAPCQNFGDFYKVVENTNSNHRITHQVEKATL